MRSRHPKAKEAEPLRTSPGVAAQPLMTKSFRHEDCMKVLNLIRRKVESDARGRLRAKAVVNRCKGVQTVPRKRQRFQSPAFPPAAWKKGPFDPISARSNSAARNPSCSNQACTSRVVSSMMSARPLYPNEPTFKALRRSSEVGQRVKRGDRRNQLRRGDCSGRSFRCGRWFGLPQNFRGTD
jgi:hypothetical protein